MDFIVSGFRSNLLQRSEKSAAARRQRAVRARVNLPMSQCLKRSYILVMQIMG